MVVDENPKTSSRTRAVMITPLPGRTLSENQGTIARLCSLTEEPLPQIVMS